MEDMTYFHELKKQAHFFFKTKINLARLALTNVTHAQLLTEEATRGNPWPPDSPTMRVITRAAFEVDDFYRIVDILQKRLEKFDEKDWRGCYNAMILLEHVVTHGPKSFAEEFQDIRQVFMEMDAFHFVDHKGFNWGRSVRKLSARLLKLLEDEEFLKEERIKARDLTRGIQGFGNLSRRSSFPATADSEPGRFSYRQSNSMPTARASEIFEKEDKSESGLSEDGEITEIDHPFCEIKNNHFQVSKSLISSVE